MKSAFRAVAKSPRRKSTCAVNFVTLQVQVSIDFWKVKMELCAFDTEFETNSHIDLIRSDACSKLVKAHRAGIGSLVIVHTMISSLKSVEISPACGKACAFTTADTRLEILSGDFHE